MVLVLFSQLGVPDLLQRSSLLAGQSARTDPQVFATDSWSD